MHTIYHTNKQFPHKGCVAAIGNFDGLHFGHQTVIKQLVNVAQDKKLPSVIITFEPLPKEYFQRSQKPVARLMRLREKLVYLQQLNIDRTVVIHFNQRFSQLSAKEFVEQYLVQALNIQYITVGADFRFGYQQQGDVQQLQQFGQDYGFEVAIAATYEQQQLRVSSSGIRNALAQGDLEGANSLLGRNYSMIGQVIRGDQRGRSIGYPTANIAIKRKVSPLLGVYVVESQLTDGSWVNGVANLGSRPTVDGTKVLLEVYLLDFDQDIYGQQVTVVFLKKLRDEKRFNSLDELKQQLQHDESATRNFFKTKA